VEQIKRALRDYIVERSAISADDPDFNDDVHLFDYGYVDSFGALDLINFVQAAFQIRITESDLVAYPLNTIREIAQFTFQRRENQ
jgi:methoxymalonate biosynthesis acyl carrier protein